MTWNSKGTIDGQLKQRKSSGNWYCDNKDHPYCPDVKLPGGSCSVRNDKCTHDPHKDSKNGCRVYQCY
jgi:hypothetical protein